MEERLILRNQNQLPDIIKAILSMKIEYPAEIRVLDLDKTRSSKQNSLYWKWLTEISQQMEVEGERFSREDWHDLCRMKFLGVKVIKLGEKEYPRPSVSTTKLKVGEFAEYLTKIEEHFLSKGVALTFTDDYGPALGHEI